MAGGRQTPRHFRQALQACENSAAAISGSACLSCVISPRRSMSIARSVRALHRRVAGSVVFNAVIDALNANASTAASLPVFRVITPPTLTQGGDQITRQATARLRRVRQNDSTKRVSHNPSKGDAGWRPRKDSLICRASAKPFPNPHTNFEGCSPDRRVVHFFSGSR